MISVGQKHNLTYRGTPIGEIEIVGITPVEFYFTVSLDEGFNKEVIGDSPIHTCPIPSDAIDIHSPYVSEDEKEEIKFKVTKRQ